VYKVLFGKTFLFGRFYKERAAQKRVTNFDKNFDKLGGLGTPHFCAQSGFSVSSGLSELIFVCAIVGRMRASSSHNGVVFNQSIKLPVIFVSHFLCACIKNSNV